MNKIYKPIDGETIIFARPDGWHYHLDKNCPMLQGGDFERLKYTRITRVELAKRKLWACPGCAIFKK